MIKIFNPILNITIITLFFLIFFCIYCVLFT